MVAQEQLTISLSLLEMLGKMASINLAETLPHGLHSGKLLVGSLGYMMFAALGCHFWRELARKRFNDLSLLWAHQFHTNIQELWLFVGEGMAACSEGCTHYRRADFRTLQPVLKRRPKRQSCETWGRARVKIKRGGDSRDP